MKRTLTILSIMLLALGLGFIARAEEAAKVTVTGTVIADTDEDGGVVAVKLTVKGENAETYQVVLNEKGKKLASLKGATVKATGTVSTTDGVKWLVVESSEKVVEEAAE